MKKTLIILIFSLQTNLKPIDEDITKQEIGVALIVLGFCIGISNKLFNESINVADMAVNNPTLHDIENCLKTIRKRSFYKEFPTKKKICSYYEYKPAKLISKMKSSGLTKDKLEQLIRLIHEYKIHIKNKDKSIFKALLKKKTFEILTTMDLITERLTFLLLVTNGEI